MYISLLFTFQTVPHTNDAVFQTKDAQRMKTAVLHHASKFIAAQTNDVRKVKLCPLAMQTISARMDCNVDEDTNVVHHTGEYVVHWSNAVIWNIFVRIIKDLHIRCAFTLAQRPCRPYLTRK